MTRLSLWHGSNPEHRRRFRYVPHLKPLLIREFKIVDKLYGVAFGLVAFQFILVFVISDGIAFVGASG